MLVRVWRMRSGISITVDRTARLRLEGVVRDRNAAQKHVWRAAIVLLSADGVGTTEIMRRTGKSKTCVWRWQERFMEEGVDGLLRDKTRPSRIPPLGPEVAERVVALTLTDPPKVPSGLRLTEESVLGFPTSSAYASLAHAHRDFPHSRLLRPPSS